ncbi:uncharacterized protein LOC112203951 [Rosa chinensis]|uniref:uncharacterized protein LOC112203951 n=1 Tax=Rosa chinensis TaxID=74649 RepID=UPI000D08D9CE|nr:uncharacterized protein LOC112203951 [Rosa chinensis]
MLEDLLEKKVIELPECKRPEEMHRVKDSKYCKYHQLVSHPVEKCFVLKDLIMNLAKQGRIELDVDDVAEVNCITIEFGSFEPASLPPLPMKAPYHLSRKPCMKSKLEEVKPTQQASLAPVATPKIDSVVDDEGLILVTRKKARKSPSPCVPITQAKYKQSQENRQCLEKDKTRFVKERSDPFVQRPNGVASSTKAFPKKGNKQEKVRTAHMTTSYEFGSKDSAKAESSTVNMNQTSKETEVLKQLEDLPLHFSISDLLQLPKSTRCALVQVLINMGKNSTDINKVKPKECVMCVADCDAIHFTDEDLQLGSKPHNRPLFVSRYVRDQKINRMHVDGGSAVNIMPRSTMKQLGINMEELSRSHLMIQGFNQRGQRAIGMIRVDMMIREMKSNTLFHVIDAKTSYNLLLGRPWVHKNGVVPSTLHQCFKFYDGRGKTVAGDTKPFTEAKSYFADSKFYMDDETIKEVLPVGVPSTGKTAELRNKWNPAWQEIPLRNHIKFRRKLK